MNEREELYEKILKKLDEYVFTGYSDEIIFREKDWSIEVYSYPPYPEEELSDEDCYLGSIYIEENLDIYWEGEKVENIDELFKKLGLW